MEAESRKKKPQRGREKQRGDSAQWGIDTYRDRSLSPTRKDHLEHLLRQRIKGHPQEFNQQDSNIRGDLGEELLNTYFNNDIGQTHAEQDYTIIDLNEVAQHSNPKAKSPGVDYLVVNKKTREMQWVQLKTLTEGAGQPDDDLTTRGKGHLKYFDPAEDARKASKWLAEDAGARKALMSKLDQSGVWIPQEYEQALQSGKQKDLQGIIQDGLHYPVPLDYYDSVRDAAGGQNSKIKQHQVLQLPYKAASIEKMVQRLFTYAQNPAGVERQELEAQQRELAQIEQQRLSHSSTPSSSVTPIQQPQETVESLTKKLRDLKGQARQLKDNPEARKKVDAQIQQLEIEREKLKSVGLNL